MVSVDLQHGVHDLRPLKMVAIFDQIPIAICTLGLPFASCGPEGSTNRVYLAYSPTALGRSRLCLESACGNTLRVWLMLIYCGNFSKYASGRPSPFSIIVIIPDGFKFCGHRIGCGRSFCHPICHRFTDECPHPQRKVLMRIDTQSALIEVEEVKHLGPSLISASA